MIPIKIYNLYSTKYQKHKSWSFRKYYSLYASLYSRNQAQNTQPINKTTTNFETHGTYKHLNIKTKDMKQTHQEDQYIQTLSFLITIKSIRTTDGSQKKT